MEWNQSGSFMSYLIPGPLKIPACLSYHMFFSSYITKTWFILIKSLYELFYHLFVDFFPTTKFFLIRLLSHPLVLFGSDIPDAQKKGYFS